MKKDGIFKTGNISCCVIAFMISFMAGQIVNLFTSDRLNIITLSAVLGIIGWYAFNKGIQKVTGMVIDSDKESGYFGIMLSVVLTLMIYGQ